MSACATTKQIPERGTFQECIGDGFDLLRRNILAHDWREINDTIEWLEKETRNICKQFDETWARAEQAEAKLNNGSIT